MAELPKHLTARLSDYIGGVEDWVKWRRVYEAGEDFRSMYLKRLSSRETKADFQERMDITPIPSDARDGIVEIKNSIFQRLGDVVRRGGSAAYQNALAGRNGGVDLRGSSMNFFLGSKIIEDLLVMGKTGVFVDMPELTGDTLADSEGKRPYLYSYCREDILNYSLAAPSGVSEFQSILLRDTTPTFDTVFGLQLDTVQRYRLLWIGDDGFVRLQFFSKEGVPSPEVRLELRRIPFVLFDLGDSLMRTLADDCITLLNLASLDANYAIKSNFPFYVEARDPRGVGSHLKRVATDGTATTGGQGASEENIRIGVTQGRAFDKDVPPPRFISPPTDPIEASMKLQQRMEDRIRRKLNLAVQSLGEKADSKTLEAGLSFIGLILEAGESRIAEHWAAYENTDPSRRQVAVIKYPDRYSLKTDVDRIDEASKLAKLVYTVPSRSAKKAIGSLIVDTLFNGKLSPDELRTIQKEIKDASFTTSDPDTVIAAKEAGLVSEKTASISLGYDDDEYLQGRVDHVERVKRLAEAQAEGQPAARGVPDMDENPQSGRDEKELSRNTDQQDTTRRRVRGRGRKRPRE